MKTVTGKILTILLSVFLLAYIGFQIGEYFYEPYRMETVYRYSVQDSVLCDGVFIRSEEVYDAEYEGVFDYVCEDGAMLSSGGEIGRVYLEESDVANIEEAQRIAEEIELLKEAKRRGEGYLSLKGDINKEINEKVREAVNAAESKSAEEAEEIKKELTKLLNVKKVIAGNAEDIEVRISELEVLLEECEDKISEPIKKLKTDKKGYFVSYTDGYESEITFEKIGNYSVKDFEDIAKAQIKKGEAIGKLVTDYEWKYAAIVPSASANKFYEGAELTLDFGIKGLKEIPAEVEKILEDESSENSVVIFSCDYISRELLKLRSHSAEIIFKEINGLRIPEKALRMVNGRSGVYILKKTVVRYKTVEILYKGVGYYVVKWDSYDSEAIQLFDEVFVEGKDLYEGKQVGENRV